VITLPSWIWPLSWYRRIQDLEAIVVALTVENKKLANQFVAESISHTSMTAYYVASMASVMEARGAALKAAAEQDSERHRTEYQRLYQAEVKRRAPGAGESRE
jgi:hypothetical protein